MDLYLIRHGETVDNVAGLYAGVTDSALTNYGHDQINRLGKHFASSSVVFSHIFASPLSRASKTAQAIQDAQPSSASGVRIIKVPDLIEQDFGYYEKRTFQARTDARRTGRDVHREAHLNDPGFVDVESKEAMAKRADRFLDDLLLPLFVQPKQRGKNTVAVVSHGMLLSTLWKRLLLRLSPKTVTIAAEVTASKGDIILQHLGGWSNTGYLELVFTKAADAAAIQSGASIESAAACGETVKSEGVLETPAVTTKVLAEYKLLIVSIDRKDHLSGLKRQRGGIGRSKHDEGQQKLDGFFKRQRTS